MGGEGLGRGRPLSGVREIPDLGGVSAFFVCKTSDVVLLFYTTSELYTKFGMVSFLLNLLKVFASSV